VKFNRDLASIHAYLCADGYVIKNPPTQRHKYYKIGLRNTNDTLLKDFQTKFKAVFGIRPNINNGRCYIGNKQIYHRLTEEFSYYCDEWTIPKLSKEELKCWLRSYFDCDGWVGFQKGKSRSVCLESVNEGGLNKIKNVFKKEFGIHVSDVRKRKNRNVWYIFICGKDDLEKFNDSIGFLHPRKKERLQDALNSYETYEWDIPEGNDGFASFVKNRCRVRKGTGQARFFSILNHNLIKLNSRLNEFGIKGKVYGPWKNSIGVSYYCLSFNINELAKLKGGSDRIKRAS
jgi:hypothetical protein